MHTLEGNLIPSDVRVEVTRNYGETANEKSNELLYHMLLAMLSVTALVWLALGRRESGIIAIAIPVTLSLTPGHYALICNIPGHYSSGMHTDFTVS